ncbi:GGDEF domain-containing protein [Desulfovibrio inopinatus]|uniref:GGDEF domain-containing protein n=1 Tax=Desulfovibrio inopinatus TaxID=102109 RepID=UPI0004819E05|nr:GGDEF domain-containing protein [Desulfovibrio inopinatus]
MKKHPSPPKDISSDKSMCSEVLCNTLSKLGVPREAKWRALILYMRSIKDYDFLTDSQKSKIQNLVVDVLKKRDFSEERFHSIVMEKELIFNEPWNEKLLNAVRETTELIERFQKILFRRRNDVSELKDRTVHKIETAESIEEAIGDIKQGFQDLFRAMAEDAEQLDKISKTDGLTKLDNRRAFDERLESALQTARESDRPLSLLMMDIDHFKKFNDTYGHLIGDQALTTVAKVIQTICKDLADQDHKTTFAARYGGEEFTLLMPDTDLLEACDIAELIRRKVETYNFIIRDPDGKIINAGLKITISIGAAQFDPQWDGNVLDKLIDMADRGLYKAKELGRNRVQEYPPNTAGMYC